MRPQSQLFQRFGEQSLVGWSRTGEAVPVARCRHPRRAARCRTPRMSLGLSFFSVRPSNFPINARS
jgi:hypothetical protein